MELNWKRYQPAGNTTVITTKDAHAAGEPLRIITGGLPELQGDTILERRRHMQLHFDHIRRALMRTPREHRDMYGCNCTQSSVFIASGSVTQHMQRYGQWP